jgi:protein-S-isoprenylcysteine O-methyltransferase Ste14
MLDHQKSYQRFFAAMKLLHVPVHTPSKRTDVQPTAQSTAVTTGSYSYSFHFLFL